jgi:hypothetical protein
MNRFGALAAAGLGGSWLFFWTQLKPLHPPGGGNPSGPEEIFAARLAAQRAQAALIKTDQEVRFAARLAMLRVEAAIARAKMPFIRGELVLALPVDEAFKEIETALKRLGDKLAQ